MAVFLEKSTCPQCKRPAIVAAHSLSYCKHCNTVKMEKTSADDFWLFSGDFADCRPRGASFDLLMTGLPGHTIVADYATGIDFVSYPDCEKDFHNGASVYFTFSPESPIHFSVKDIASGWASNFINYFAGLSVSNAIIALEYFLWCRQDDLTDWQDAFICSHYGDNDSAITAYAEYLADSGVYSDTNIPHEYINWRLVARDSWCSGDVFFTDNHVFYNR